MDKDEDEDLEMSPKQIARLKKELEDAKTDSAMDRAWEKFYGEEKSEEDVPKYAGGGVVDGASYSRTRVGGMSQL